MLSQEGWGFQQLYLIKEKEWLSMGLPRDLRVMVLKKQKEWIAVATRVMIEEEVQRQQQSRASSVDEVSSR